MKLPNTETALMIEQPTPAAGLRIPMHEYHHGEEWRHLLSSHRFFPMYTSAASYRWQFPDGLTTDALRLGQLAAHVQQAVFEGEDPRAGIEIIPEWGFQTKIDKLAWSNYMDELKIEPYTKKDEILSAISKHFERQGKVLCSEDEFRKANNEASSILNNGLARELLDCAQHELTFAAKGCKARPDCVSDNILIDFKRSAVDPRRWQRHARDLGYPAQMAWYERVMGLCGRTVDVWAWIVTEPKPFRLDEAGREISMVHVWVADEYAREQALDRLEDALFKLFACAKSGEWPDYEPEINKFYPDQED